MKSERKAKATRVAARPVRSKVPPVLQRMEMQLLPHPVVVEPVSSRIATGIVRGQLMLAILLTTFGLGFAIFSQIPLGRKLFLLETEIRGLRLELAKERGKPLPSPPPPTPIIIKTELPPAPAPQPQLSELQLKQAIESVLKDWSVQKISAKPAKKSVPVKSISTKPAPVKPIAVESVPTKSLPVESLPRADSPVANKPTAQKEAGKPAYSLSILLRASAHVLDAHIGDLAGQHGVARLDAGWVDLAREAQHVHVLGHADLLFAGHDQVPVGEHLDHGGGDGAGEVAGGSGAAGAVEFVV